MKVSIIIPVYNSVRYIHKCLDSVSMQANVDDIECIIIDDCSKDESVSVISNYLKNYQGYIQFKIFQQEHNQGPSAARNRGIREAQGEYVFFLDADDTITPDCIESLYGMAKQYDADYVQGTYQSNELYHMPKYDTNMPVFTDNRRFIKKTLLNYMVIPFTPHNRMVKRQQILDHDLFFTDKIYVREDFHWMFFLAKYVSRMAICKKETYFRGYNEESLTHRINVEREKTAYKTLIEDFCNNIDPFLRGEQKCLILDTLIMAISQDYYSDNEKKHLIDLFKCRNNGIENLLLSTYLKVKNLFIKTESLHLLKKIYRSNH